MKTFDEVLLRKLYVEKGLTINAMCKILRTSSHTLGRELKKLGITRTNSEIHKKHGMSDSRPYKIWQGMKTRCDNRNAKKYHLYGGKGIKYCDKWRTFEGFWDDMGGSYKDGLTLDRLDNNVNYCKENCRWGSYYIQNNNKSDNVNAGKNVKELMEITGLSQNAIYRRIRLGWSKEEIINTPKLSNNGQEKSKEGGEQVC